MTVDAWEAVGWRYDFEGRYRHERRRHDRHGPAFAAGLRVEVTGPFEARVGLGTIRKVTRTGHGVIVDLDSGHDVLVTRRFARPIASAE